jgi:hypothetical protein
MFGVSMVNGTMVASVAGSALTFVVKTLAGNDPSATDPVWFVYRDATLANGDYSVIEVTAALSTTIPSGSTLGTSNATPFKLWLAAINDAGTVSLAVINCFNAATNNIFPLSAGGVVSVTAYGGGANNVATFFGTAGHTNVPYSVLGYASYETGSTLATAGTWSAAPTRQELLRPGVALPGARVQSLVTMNGAASTGSNNYSPSSTAPTAAGGNLVASQSVTPRSSAHVMRVHGEALLGTTTTATVQQTVFITQDAGSNALASAGQCTTQGTTSPQTISVFYQALASTLVSTTFKLYGTTNGAVVTNVNTVAGGSAFYGGTGSTYILVEEIAT